MSLFCDDFVIDRNVVHGLDDLSDTLSKDIPYIRQQIRQIVDLVLFDAPKVIQHHRGKHVVKILGLDEEGG